MNLHFALGVLFIAQAAYNYRKAVESERLFSGYALILVIDMLVVGVLAEAAQ